MIVAVDFDGTVVRPKADYADTTTPLEFVEGAQRALRALHRAGHQLILSSARANLSLRVDWRLDPLSPGEFAFRRNQPINEARYQEMRRFVAENLAGIFAYIDDGRQGKLLADVFIDDRALDVAIGWDELTARFGEPEAAA